MLEVYSALQLCITSNGLRAQNSSKERPVESACTFDGSSKQNVSGRNMGNSNHQATHSSPNAKAVPCVPGLACGALVSLGFARALACDLQSRRRCQGWGRRRRGTCEQNTLYIRCLGNVLSDSSEQGDTCSERPNGSRTPNSGGPFAHAISLQVTNHGHAGV